MKWLILLTLFSFSSLAETSSEKLGFECTYNSLHEASVRLYEHENKIEKRYQLYLSALKNCPTESLFSHTDIEIWSSDQFVSIALKTLDIKLMQKLLDAGLDINEEIRDYFGTREYGTVLFHAEKKLDLHQIGSFTEFWLTDEAWEKRKQKVKKLEAFVKFLKENGGSLETNADFLSRVFF